MAAQNHSPPTIPKAEMALQNLKNAITKDKNSMKLPLYKNTEKLAYLKIKN
jgi:hypothetical protein